MSRKLLIAFLCLCLALAFAGTEDAAECETDTECMELCHPDDSDCDGGPQS